MEMRAPSDAGVMHAMTRPARLIVLVFELLDRALPAGSHRTHGRVPAEVGKVKSPARGRPANTFCCGDCMAGHRRPMLLSPGSSHGALFYPGTPLLINVLLEVSTEIF